MKRTYLLMLWAAGLLLTAACANDGDMMVSDMSPSYNYSNVTGVYDGEWTVNKQVVDTARLEIGETLKLRLPEDYLIRLCFPDKSGAESPQPQGKSIVVYLSTQGYSEQMELYNFFYAIFDQKNGKRFYSIGYYYATITDVDYRIDLLSNDYGNAIFRLDTQLWTIAIPIRGFFIINTITGEEREQPLSQPITIYYNAKTRIR